MTNATDQLLASILLSDHGADGPYDSYQQLRDSAPVLVSSAGTVVLTNWIDCDSALRNKALGKVDESLGFRLNAVPEDLQRRAMARFRRTMLFRNPPEHSRLRRLVSEAFTQRHVADLEQRTARTIDDFLDQIDEVGRADIISDLALPLPVAVIGDLLGVPAHERSVAAPLVRKLMAPLEPSADAGAIAEAAIAEDELADYFRQLLAKRRSKPENDLLSRLVAARDDEALDEDECIGTAMLIFAAGFETTTNLIGNGLAALLSHRSELDRLRNDPGLIEQAIDEMLRYDAPIQTDGRTALRHTEVGGVAVDPGTVVLMLLGAANRDPNHYDQPDKFDIGRTGPQSLAFGAGIHYCLGAPLARLEARLLFPRILERFPGIHVAETPVWRPGLTFRGLESLVVSTT